MALAGISLMLVLASQQAAHPDTPDVGVQPQAVLNITKHYLAHYDPGKVPKQGSWSGGMDETDISEGQVDWSVEDSSYEGKPCKLFQAYSKFEYRHTFEKKKITFTPTLHAYAQISPSGRLLHSNTSLAGLNAAVTVDAIYNKDSIDITKTVGSQVSQTTLFPNFSMDLFDNLFQPLIKDGLVVAQERQLAFLNPSNGAPCIIKASLDGHFQGQLYFRKYEGYKLQTTSPDVNFLTTSLISRHGQLLQITLPDNQDAVAYADVGTEEQKNWGHFQEKDWNVPASISQPGRSLYQTMAVPVLLTQPSYMIVPVPFAVALKNN
jgi:hypothetical protein